MPEITDEDRARAWLETQDHQTRIWFAARCALRSMPGLGFVPGQMKPRIMLVSLPAMLVSAAAATCPLRDIRALHGVARLVSALGMPSPRTPGFVAGHDFAIRAAEATTEAGTWAARSVPDASGSVDAAARAVGCTAKSANAVAFAAYTDREATDAAASKDTLSQHLNNWPQLWLGKEIPDGLAQGWRDLRTYMASDSKSWGFWLQWYEAILEGRPLPWDLSFAIATQMTAADWEREPRAVHDRIIEIREAWERARRPDTVPELETQKLVQHVQRLLAHPEMTAITAEGTADLLERAIRQYLDDAPANHLPDELQHLDALPPIFRRIATLVKSHGTAETKERELTAEIERLNAENAHLEAALRDARSKTVDGMFRQSAIKAMGTAFGTSVVGGTGLALCHFFGVSVTDLTLDNLRGWLSDVQRATPAPETGSALPPTLDV